MHLIAFVPYSVTAVKSSVWGEGRKPRPAKAGESFRPCPKEMGCRANQGAQRYYLASCDAKGVMCDNVLSLR